ncbi:MAG: o-succinylbenzoate synthase [Anaerolineales bacterium]
MRIERARLFRVDMPLVRPFRTSFGEERDRQCVLVALEGEGVVGWGECPATRWPGYSYETAGTVWEVLTAHFLPVVLGKSVEGVDDLLAALQPFRGHPMARAGLEMALWDLLGRARGESLQSMLGGAGDRVPVGISLGIQNDPAELESRIAAALAAGYQRVKLKIEPGRDVLVVRRMRTAFPDLRMQVDANAAYSRADFDQLVALDEFGLTMIEQPLAEADWVGHQQLQTRLRTPLCLDESIHSAADARLAIEMGACRIINIKAGRVGGLSEAVKIHDLCWQADVPVWCGGLLETGIGRAANLALASLPGFRYPGDISATDRYYEQDIASPRFELQDGCLPVPQTAGLGVEVIPDAMDQFSVQKKELVAG